ncbi:MAG: GNAT family N-acetyltransferase [Rhodobacteraceae bacterium]|nr:GNAT family N-acetyltransferase [Paracoccaceae bacterium]
MIHEIGATGPVTARQLAQALGLDEAQLSRMLARLQRSGVVDAAGGRAARRSLRLDAMRDRTLLESLTAQSRTALAALIPAERRGALAEALAGVRQLIRPGAVAIRPLQPGDAGWIIGQHGALYAREQGYDQGFEALVARIMADQLDRGDTLREHSWIAEVGGPDAPQRLGTISCMREDDQTARLRLFLIVPEARGLGLGQRLHDTCVGFARQAGYRRMVLWTHQGLHAACALYARSGWRLVRSVPGRAYGQDVVDQDWEITL